MKTTAQFYYDIISPYAYLFTKMRQPLEDRLNLEPVPIFFPGLLRAQNNVGPAEVPEKRIHTYTFCVWKARQLGIPFQFPKRHPFSSVAAMRLLYEQKANWDMVDRAFEFVWKDGGDPETHWLDFCVALGLPASTDKPQSDEIKQGLTTNTQQAAKQGVFGVPAIVVNGRPFWGCDSIDWILEFLDHPGLFDEPAFKNAIATHNPLLDKVKKS